MKNLDQNLFLALNFDGSTALDRIMLAVSGTALWIPLYVLILWLVWRRDGWKRLALFIVLMVAAIALSDMVAGIFKHNGLLGGLLPDFEPRPRPMFTPALEGLTISPDSLRTLRGAVEGPWLVHVPREAIGGLYGTVSAHAATIVALATLACTVIRRRWFTVVMVLSAVAICYSRIYLGKHYPMDLAWGALLGLLLGSLAAAVYRRTLRRGARRVR